MSLLTGAVAEYRAIPTALTNGNKTLLNVDANRNLKTVDAGALFAQKVTVVGDITYAAKADIGTAQATAAWQCQKVTVSGADTVVTWADGNSNFDNVATDLTALTYS